MRRPWAHFRSSRSFRCFRTIDPMHEFSDSNRREQEIQRAVSAEDEFYKLWEDLLFTFGGDNGAGIQH